MMKATNYARPTDQHNPHPTGLRIIIRDAIKATQAGGLNFPSKSIRYPGILGRDKTNIYSSVFSHSWRVIGLICSSFFFAS